MTCCSGGGCFTTFGYGARTVDLTAAMSGPQGKGGSFRLSSAPHTDYRGNSIFGGQKLSLTLGTSGYKIIFDILGMNYLANSGKIDLADISTRTTSGFAAVVAPASLMLKGGNLEVINNLQKSTLALTANDVKWELNGDCYCPTSGILTGSYSGSKSGSASIAFSATCGAITVTLNGVAKDVNIERCSAN